MMIRKIAIGLIVGVLSSITQSVCASTVTIKNDDTASVDVVIEPGEGTLVGSTPQISRKIAPGQEVKVTVTKEDFGGASTFSVKGSVTMPSAQNRCTGLFVDEDYEVVFSGAKTGGTVCRSKKMSSSEKEGKVGGKDKKSHEEDDEREER